MNCGVIKILAAIEREKESVGSLTVGYSEVPPLL